MWVRDNEMIAKGDINRMREDAKGMYEGLKSWQYILRLRLLAPATYYAHPASWSWDTVHSHLAVFHYLEPRDTSQDNFRG